MAIFAYGDPSSSEKRAFIYNSIVNDKISRFLWSYIKDCDLNRLKDVAQKNEDEQRCWKHAHNLLGIKPGDWIIHVNVPEWGKVTAVHVASEYFYQEELPSPQADGRYCFKVDEFVTFDRNDNRVHPMLSARLKLQGAFWRVYCESEFEASLKLLKEKQSDEVSEKIHLVEESKNLLVDLTKKIHDNNPGKKLELFLAEVFRQVPKVVEVKENGFGWGTDYGADLIIKYREGIISSLERERTLVVQVKSFEGEHWDTAAVDQLATAIDTYNASMGIIMTTGTRTEALEKAFNSLASKLEEEKNIPIYLLAGTEVAQFVLQYGMNLLFEEA